MYARQIDGVSYSSSFGESFGYLDWSGNRSYVYSMSESFRSVSFMFGFGGTPLPHIDGQSAGRLFNSQFNDAGAASFESGFGENTPLRLADVAGITVSEHDTFTDRQFSVLINLGAGNDTVEGGFGGDGFDFIHGGFGSDRVNGGDGGDRFFHIGQAGHGSDWIQDYDAAEGDILRYGGASRSLNDFQVNFANTSGAGADGVDEAFVIYRPTGQILWALIDGAAQDEINIQLGGTVYDLMG